MTQYLHPSVDTKIVDNSAVFQTADGATTLLQVLSSPIGPDGVLTKVTTANEFIFKFGTPNLSRYGQAAYNVIEWLTSGGTAQVLRVLPSTSTFAITGICAELATSAVDGPQIAIRSYSGAAQLTSVGGITTFLNSQRALAVDRATIPLGVVYPYGRGDGYNNIGISFSLRDDLDATYNFRTYDAVITGKDSLGNDVEIDGPFLVSFDPQAISKSRESLYWGSVINKYSRYLRVADSRTAFEDITEFLLANVTDGVDVDPSGIDILFGQPRNLAEAPLYAEMKWVNADNAAGLSPAIEIEANTLLDVNGVAYLKGGTVGAWTGEDSETALMVRAYTGLIDPSILDKKFVELDILLDANYDAPVKDAMASLASDIRADCMAILDLNFQANEQQTIDHRSTKVTASHANVAIFAHDMEVYDAFNGENIKVTSTYLLASKIPVNDIQFGIQYTFVGPRRGVISGFENINFIPNPTWREALYKAKINYIERDPKKTNFGTQLTSQAINSALSDINNVRALLKIRRDVEAMMSDYRMEFNDSITQDSANYDLSNYLQKWTANRTCSSISGSISASDYDRQQKMARVTIELTFTGILERIAIQIVVNR